MTGRTHDLAAFTALSYIVAISPLPKDVSFATAIVAFSANMIGGLAPDIDQPTADLWHKLPAGGLYSRLITPILGGHRFISHSILGIVLFGLLTKYLLNLASSVLLVDMEIVWNVFMIGFISHIVMDTFTKEGVPWLFPIPIKLGFPPFSFLRIKTGGLMEKSVIFPGLLLLNGYIFYTYHGKFLELIHLLK
jgi:inner membrane protein